MGTPADKKFDFSVIRTLRRKNGLSAEDLARKAGLTRATVVNVESGQANPTLQTLESLAAVFNLLPSELVRMTEGARLETAQAVDFEKDGYTGQLHRFEGFEVFHITAGAGVRKEADPEFHENTREIFLVLKGRLKIHLGGRAVEVRPGQAVRFNAMQEHWFEVAEDAEFLNIHHSPG